VAAAYGAAVGAATVAQRRLIYFPDPTPDMPEAYDLPEMAVVEFSAKDGTTLRAWSALIGRTAPTILFLQSNSRNVSARAYRYRRWIEAGFSVLALCYRGYGGSGGRPSEKGLYQDADAALAFLADQGISQELIVLIGESLGTGVAVDLAARNTVGAVILESPFTSIPDIAASAYPALPFNHLVRDKFDSISKIGDVQSPLLIAHGTDDRVIPYDMGRRLYEAANQPKEFVGVKRATHSDLWSYDVPKTEIEFIRRHVQKRQLADFRDSGVS